MATVAIIDSGGANINSVVFACRRLGVEPEFTGDRQVIESASHVILPGVGAAATAMQRLRELELVDVISNLKQPVLGICLGMQLLFESSDEGDTKCLGIIPARVTAIARCNGLSLPHTGWNEVRIRNERAEHPLFQGFDPMLYGYFVHGFAAPVGSWTMALTRHGDEFSSIVARDNFCGIQFHPERSGEAGARLLDNFFCLEWRRGNE